MKKYHCKYCKQYFEFEKQQHFAGHCSRCEHNPKLNKRQATIKQIQTNSLKKEIVLKRCKQCGKDFEVIRHNGYEQKKEKKCCSVSCARKFASLFNKEDRCKKTSDTIKKKIENGESVGFVKSNSKLAVLRKFNCKYCNKEIETKNSNKQFCSGSCVTKYSWEAGKFNHINRSELATKSNIKAYKNGRKVSGGNTKWIPYKNIKVQGTYELRTCIILDKLKELDLIKDWSYTNDRIIYEHKDKSLHTYLLDFKVIKNNDKIQYIETKGYEQEKDFYKWKSARASGLVLKIWKLQRIQKIEKKLKIKN
jgi:hypothetical protein